MPRSNKFQKGELIRSLVILEVAETNVEAGPVSTTALTRFG